tara:strand:+ start:770 stop:1327 length:558 start_codon:yes stop_codon:yes gene_type:complete
MSIKTKVFITVFVLLIIGFLLRVDLRLRYYLDTSDVIIYGNNVTINDFKSSRKAESSNILYTHGFGCVYNLGPFPFINCFSYFEPNNSWIKRPLDKKTELDFELHKIIFKLNELCARKLEIKVKRLIENDKKPNFDKFSNKYHRMIYTRDSLKLVIEKDDYVSYQQKIEKWSKWIDNKLVNCCDI